MKLTFKEFVPGGRQDRRGRHRLFSRTTDDSAMRLMSLGHDDFLLTVGAPGGELELQMSREELGQLNWMTGCF